MFVQIFTNAVISSKDFVDLPRESFCLVLQELEKHSLVGDYTVVNSIYMYMYMYIYTTHVSVVRMLRIYMYVCFSVCILYVHVSSTVYMYNEK